MKEEYEREEDKTRGGFTSNEIVVSLVDEEEKEEDLVDNRGSRNNASVVYNEGYVAGYNQALVDNGVISQEDADAVLTTFWDENDGNE